MLLQVLELCGRYARWVLPLGLLGGFALPWAAEPASRLIGPAIWVLLFLAVVRLSTSAALSAGAQDRDVRSEGPRSGAAQRKDVQSGNVQDRNVQDRNVQNGNSQNGRVHDANLHDGDLHDGDAKDGHAQIGSPGGKAAQDENSEGEMASIVIPQGLQPVGTSQHFLTKQALLPLFARTLIAQLALPLLVFAIATIIQLPDIWRLAATLVAAAPAISGSPNLVLLLKGDGALTLRWLIAGTVLLPVTCLPILMLVFDEQTTTVLLLPAARLLLLILSATAAGFLVSRWLRTHYRRPSNQALDGAAAITLALMVIGLMSAVHAPDTRLSDFFIALLAAIIINGGLQLLGAYGARWLNQPRARIIASGVVYGNRNIALYLTALPASFTEPLLLFIACYQIPMYLTPLLGDVFYRRLE